VFSPQFKVSDALKIAQAFFEDAHKLSELKIFTDLTISADLKLAQDFAPQAAGDAASLKIDEGVFTDELKLSHELKLASDVINAATGFSNELKRGGIECSIEIIGKVGGQ